MMHFDESFAPITVFDAKLKAARLAAECAGGFQACGLLSVNKLPRTFSDQMSTSKGSPLLRFLGPIKRNAFVG